MNGNLESLHSTVNVSSKSTPETQQGNGKDSLWSSHSIRISWNITLIMKIITKYFCSWIVYIPKNWGGFTVSNNAYNLSDKLDTCILMCEFMQGKKGDWESCMNVLPKKQ